MRTAASAPSAGMLLALAASAAASLPAAAAAGSQVGPVTKVIEMLESMVTKAKSGKQEEATQWAAYKQYCTDAEGAKQTGVKEMNLQVEALESSIEKHKVDIEDLGNAIVDHKADIEEYKNSTINATAARKAERESYEVLHQDYSESVTACQQAIEVLASENYKRPGQAAAFLERVMASARVPPKARRVLTLYLAQTGEEPDPLSVTAPLAHAYEFQSGAILDMLKELKTKFEDERRALEKAELEKRHAYEMLAQDYRSSLAAAEHEMAKKEKIKGDLEVALADAEGQLTSVTTARDADLKFLEDLRGTCQQKASDFEARQKLRGEEIETLTGAIEILKGEGVSGTAKEHLRSLLERRGRSAPARGTSLVQAGGGGAERGAAAERRSRAVAYLEERAAKIGSSVLVASAARAREDPFGKVKKMLQDLIERLQAQEAEEAEHKAWCDGELGVNKQTRDTKTKEVESLHSTIDELQNDIAILERDIAKLSEAVAQLQKAMAEAEELRTKERAENQDTIAEAVEAQGLVSQAVSMLKDFYDKAAESTAFAQIGRAGRFRKAPPTFDTPYKGLPAADRNNIFAFLEVIQSDFARLESETTNAENTAQQEHDDFMEASKEDRDQKDADIKRQKDELVTKKEDLDTSSTNLDMAQSELDAALEYYDKLKPSCIGTQDTGASDYSARVRRREEEIASLREALAILSGDSLPGGPPAEALYSGVDGGNRGYDVGIVAGR